MLRHTLSAAMGQDETLRPPFEGSGDRYKIQYEPPAGRAEVL